jgi:hypothetical protein
MALPEKSSTPRQVRPGRHLTLGRGLIWPIQAGIGVAGLWKMGFSGPEPMPVVLHIMALLLLSVPAIVIHELGHYCAARLLGFTVLELNVGSGDVIWKTSVGNLNILLRQVPLCGHVMHLPRPDKSRWTEIAFLAAGPLANLATAAACLAFAGVTWATYWKHPELSGACVVVSLWHGLLNLIPFPLTARTSFVQGSDGWLIGRLLLGKPSTLTLKEIESAKKPPSGLAYLEKQGNRSRRTLAGLILFSGLIMFFFAFAVYLPHRVGLTRDTGEPPMSLVAIVLLMFGVLLLAVAVWCWRRPWTSFVERVRKSQANPLTQETYLYTQTITSEAQHLRMLDLPEDFLVRIVRSATQPMPSTDFIPFIDRFPDNLLLPLLRFDSLLHERRFEDAVTALDAVLARDDLAPRVRSHLRSCRLVARLLSPENEGAAEECERAVEDDPDDGPRMRNGLTFGTVILEADRPEFLALAERWLFRAQEIYPFAPAVHICLGRLMLCRGEVEAAETWFRRAAEETAGTNEASVVRAWQAVAAATSGHPKAPALLRSCLKQDLPFTLRQRVEGMLQTACPTTGVMLDKS